MNAPEPKGMDLLEIAIGRLLRIGVVTSSGLLAAGVAMTLSGYAPSVSRGLLTTAIVILMATPVARVVVSLGEYIRERDWLFVALTTIVLLTLAGSVAAAFWR
jgi:uncharacterized membrane protein